MNKSIEEADWEETGSRKYKAGKEGGSERL